MPNNIPLIVGEIVEADTANTWARGYLRKNTAKSVSGTASATDLLNGEFTLPGGALGIDKILRLDVWGEWKQNTGGANKLPRFQFKLGSTTLIDTLTTSGNVAANSGNYYRFRMSWTIQNLASASSQFVSLAGKVLYQEAATEILGNNDIVADSNGVASYESYDTTAVDTTVSLALVLNVINASSSASYETKLLGALVEII